MSNSLTIATKVIRRIISPRLSRANVAVTYKCNYKCRTCNIWQTYKKDKSLLHSEMTIEEFEKIATYNDFIWLSITGGEPFLRNDIGKLLIIAARNADVISTTTNGSKPELIEKTIKGALSQRKALIACNVSLEGEEKLHDAFTGREGAWRNATETIDRLSAIKNSGFKLGIETLISEHTVDDREYVRKLAEQAGAGIVYTIEQHANYYNNNNNPINLPPFPKVKLSRNLLSLGSYMFLKKANSSNNTKKMCVAGQYSCFIDPYCNVYPCLFFVPNKPLKNLRQTGFAIGKLDYKGLVSSCEGCWTPCEAHTAMMFKPWRLL